MIAYGIGVLPLIRELRGSHPRGTQPWYADDASAGGKFTHILAHLRDLQARGPPRGSFPEPTKIILVVDPQNLGREEDFLRGVGLKVVTGSRYHGRFIGESEAEKSCLAGKVAGWADSVDALAGVSHKHPQSSYSGLQKSLHQ